MTCMLKIWITEYRIMRYTARKRVAETKNGK